jgi:hypothetical protein
MPAWLFLGGIAAGASLLAGRGVYRRRQQRAAAEASGLEPVDDLTHVSAALQRTALWSLADGGFERRVVHGTVTRGGADVAVTAFDLETLRERRGEWAWLPVEPPFRIGGVVSVVVCELDRSLPHVLLKRAGSGDKLIDDDGIERAATSRSSRAMYSACRIRTLPSCRQRCLRPRPSSRSRRAGARTPAIARASPRSACTRRSRAPIAVIWSSS